MINESTNGNLNYKYSVVPTVDNEGTDVATDAQTKAVAASFENEYKKSNAKLTINKQVDGDAQYSDKDKEFEYTITFKYPTTATEDEKKAVTFKKADGTEVTISAEGKFTLKQDESLVVENLPVGTKCTLVESADTNYKASVVVFEDEKDTTATGVGKETKAENFNESLQALGSKLTDNKNLLVGENTNEANYTNTMNQITVTGIVTNVAPFIAMMAAAVAAIALYLVGKRKLRAI